MAVEVPQMSDIRYGIMRDTTLGALSQLSTAVAYDWDNPTSISRTAAASVTHCMALTMLQPGLDCHSATSMGWA